MEKKGYRELIKASLEEILERNAQINEIKDRFDKLKEDIAKSSNPDDLAKIKEADQIADCFESAVDAFNARMNQKIRSYCEINSGKRRGKCYVH